MKKNIIKTVLFAAMGFATLTSCEEDTVTYGGENFVSYDKVSVTNVKAFENGGVFELPVYIAFPKSNDVVVKFEVSSDVAQEGVHYEVLTPSTGLVIPAGQTQASIMINVIDNDVLNDSKSLKVKLVGVDDSSVTVGLNDVASYDKTVLLLNNDCTTNFFTWVSDLSYVSTGGDVPETGTSVGDVNANGDCNILVVTGDFAYGPAQEFPTEFVFTPGASAAQGNVTAAEQIWCQQCYEDEGKTYDVLFSGTGTYNSNTKELKIDGTCKLSLGSFPTRTIVFKPAE